MSNVPPVDVFTKKQLADFEFSWERDFICFE